MSCEQGYDIPPLFANLITFSVRLHQSKSKFDQTIPTATATWYKMKAFSTFTDSQAK